MNIFNSPNVIVHNCTFYNNTSDKFTRQPYKGNAGGLSIGYNLLFATISLDIINITVYSCNFTNNHAGSLAYELPLNGIFTGRGGGLSLVVNVTGMVICTVNNSIFVNNFADRFGGGVYISASERSTLEQFYFFANNNFTSNAASNGAGGVFFANVVFPSISFSQTLVLYNSTFTENKAEQIGGGIFVFSLGLGGSFVKIEKCDFFMNTAGENGGAFAVRSVKLYGNRQNQNPVEFVSW